MRDGVTDTLVLCTSQSECILKDDYNIAIICRFFPEKATILAVDILNELVEVSFTVVLFFLVSQHEFKLAERFLFNLF